MVAPTGARRLIRVGGRARERLRAILASSTFRLALLYVVLLATSMIFLLGFVYWSTAGYMARQTDATINAEIRGLAEQYRRRGPGGLKAVIAERLQRDPGGAGLYLLVNGAGQPLVGNLNRWPPDPIAPTGWMDFRVRDPVAAPETDRDRSEAARAKVFRLRGGMRLLVGRDVRELNAVRALMLDALWSGLAITVALALLGGWLISASVVRRLEAVNQVSREIMEGDLSRRVPADGSGDDFDQLAANLNRMLTRIEQLMASVRQVSDNIAHDLRTPLTRLRAKLELLVQGELPDDARADAEEAVADAEELLGTFNALLRIARIESGSRRAAFARFDLADSVRDLAELYEPLAADREQRLELTVPAELWVVGDRDLLFQACANLVENAIKYTPAGGLIELKANGAATGLATEKTTATPAGSLSGPGIDGVTSGATAAAGPDREVRVTVADSGPGIPPQWREKVCERFFRLDHSRSSPGSGLGLSLVRAVVDLHDARLELDDNGPGLRVSIVIPAMG
ncbi:MULTISPECIES: sensor histidine kinase [Thiorhodovibrio]|uniref:sensor histidine kinase n=1 Tax=Thiorhodovibrio TaxID=61593 RepID=UPI0019134098|nr:MULTISPECIES: HAMP domain-containing sensor histidine kinase [Thiorhodovibrio]MBK5969934.1 two-component sensor histidine kinase [Thiorhodovibrio winogradskyi]WPL12019.1 Phosphate regulon sensor protein PhoR [Thiorhodovibrio litoralis]